MLCCSKLKTILIIKKAYTLMMCFLKTPYFFLFPQKKLHCFSYFLFKLNNGLSNSKEVKLILH